MDRTPAPPVTRSAVEVEAGVTLIEIMIVLAIIALIMGFLVGPKVMNAFKQAKVRTAWMMAKEYEGAYAQWSADHEDPCPAQLEELAKYTNRKDLKDPFGSLFVMKCGEQAPEGASDTGFGVLSLGPDKREGTGDDIKSWEKLR
jgi:prepilin-type N-terminal cleavage/methylation domain-containing protein